MEIIIIYLILKNIYNLEVTKKIVIIIKQEFINSKIIITLNVNINVY